MKKVAAKRPAKRRPAKKAYLKKQFENAVYGLVGKNIEMFKKLETNQSAQNMIFKAIYKNYTDGLGFSQ